MSNDNVLQENTDLQPDDFSNPPAVPLVLDVEQEIKIPMDTIDNRAEVVEEMSKSDIDEYGRPNLELSQTDLQKKQHRQDLQNLKEIDKSFAAGEIDENTKNFLYSYYKDSTEIYHKFKQSINGLFGCNPKSIKYINLLEGKIDNETPYFYEHVNPNTTMVFEYEIEAPWRVESKIPGSPVERINILVVVPKMKDVKRAIQKVKIGGKYDLERQKELAKLKSGQTIEEAGLDKAKLRTPLQKMKDILRCSVLAPRYDDVLALYSQSLTLGLADKSSRPSKYLDNNIQNAQLFFKNSKNYRDMKNYLHIQNTDGEPFNFFGEVQYKMEAQFFRADIKTHLEYEYARKHQQEFFAAQTEGDKKLINAKIYNRLLNIQKLNSQAFDYYNLSVLQDARILEDRLKNRGFKPDKDGTFGYCRELLDNNLLVRSSMALTDKTFEKAPAWLKDMYQRYKLNVDKKYLVKLLSKYNKKGKQKTTTTNLAKMACKRRGR